jgi:2-haloacid dehalogenase
MLKPKYITFDCYGTLTHFQMSNMARVMLKDRVPVDKMDAFVRDFGSYRFDEVLGAWKPYREVIADAYARTCKRWGMKFDAAEAEAFYRAIPTWGPNPDVPAPLAKVAAKIPLVILSNASNDQIQANVKLLGAPFHAVYTAESARAYKPRFQAFEYMFDQLGCAPADLLHVSSSLRYDLITANMLGIGARAFVTRGHDHGNPAWGYHEIKDMSGLPGLVGL